MSEQHEQRTHVVVVTGVSGAGKSTVLRTLEDLGHFCIDNLPTVLAPQTLELCARGGITRVALGIDVRVRAFLGTAADEVDHLVDGGRREVSIVFCDASEETILRRFGETRRPHALATVEGTSALAVLDGLHIERERLAPLRERATHVFDTTHLSVHELRRAIVATFGPASPHAPHMAVRIVSFGFKYGAPVDADLVFDVRFLENPYFVPELRPLAGTDPRVAGFVLNLPETQPFLEKVLDLLRFTLPKYEREGKSYLTVAIGCTGGRHRSVALSEVIGRALNAQVVHRDVAREHGHAINAPPASATGPYSASAAVEHALALSPLPQPVSGDGGGPSGASR